MKKILVILIAVLMASGLVACSKPTEKEITEELAKEIAKEIGEEIVDLEDISVDTDEDGKITVDDGEDQLVIEGSEDGMPWPGDELPGNVPELKGVLVISVASTGEGLLIGFEECDNEEGLAYIEELLSNEWTILMNMTDESGGMINASSEAGEFLIFVWNVEEGGGALTYSSAPQ